MAMVSVTIPWWIALVAGVVGAFVGTAVGMFSTTWARSTAVKDRARELRAARRGAADELERLAAFLERCLVGGIPPNRAVELARASDLIPPLQRWHDCQSMLAADLKQDAWRTVSLAVAQWALIYDAICAEAGSPEWSVETRRAIATLHNDALAARAAVDLDEGAVAAPARASA
jgi:hypothetical protein